MATKKKVDKPARNPAFKTDHDSKIMKGLKLSSISVKYDDSLVFGPNPPPAARRFRAASSGISTKVNNSFWPYDIAFLHTSGAECLGNRLILNVASEATSNIALDRPGAELLLDKGRLAAKLNGEQRLVFAQAPIFV